MISWVARYIVERAQRGIPRTTGAMDREVLFLVDGAGGFQYCASMVRRALRLERVSMGTVLFEWQYGLRGDIFSDLMWYRRNRYMAAKLARKLLAFRREHPDTRMHLFAVSAGTGIAAFACEYLKSPTFFETIVLACPALCPTYNLAQTLRSANRTYALISRRDSVVLGLGTRLFGTVDRRFESAAGRTGFRLPECISDEDRQAYRRLNEVDWSRAMLKDGNAGGHGGWVTVPFLRRHLLPLLQGRPALNVHGIGGI